MVLQLIRWCRSAAASYFRLQAINSVENQLSLTLSVKSSCGYYLSDRAFLRLVILPHQPLASSSASLSKDSFQPALASCSMVDGSPTCRKVIFVLPSYSSKVTVTSISNGQSPGIP